MKYLELSNNYYILDSIIHNNNTVFICRNKDSFLYEFFTKNQDEFQLVSPKEHLALKEIYKENTNNFVSYYVSNAFEQSEKNYIYQAHAVARKLISDYVFSLPKTLQRDILSRMDSVHFTKNPYDDKYIYAYFLYSNNSINLNFNFNDFNHQISCIIHEMLHCASTDKRRVSTGISSDLSLSGKRLKFRLNEFLNESYTELITKRIVAKNPQFSKKQTISFYAPILYLIDSLLKFADTYKFDEAYFSNDSNKFLNTLKDEFYIENIETVIKLSMLFDCVHDSLIFDYSNKNDYSNTKIHIISAGKIICDFIINKHINEQKSLKKLKFNEIFSKFEENTIMEKIFNECLRDINLYFDYKKEFSISHTDSFSDNTSEILTEHSQIFLNCVANGKQLPTSFPEEFKTPELFNFALSKRFFQSNNFINISNLDDVLKTIFDQKNNYLPIDTTVQAKIIQILLYNSNILLDTLFKVIPKDTLVYISNTNLNIFEKVCSTNVLTLFPLIKDLSYNKKTSRIFYYNLLIAIKNKENKLNIIKEYLSCLTNSQRNSLIENGNFLYLAQQKCNLSKDETEDLSMFVKNLDNQEELYI